jgi:hypothetical protein
MPRSSFGDALSRLWSHGDARIPGLRAGMFAVSFFAIACLNAARANEATLPFGYNCADVRAAVQQYGRATMRRAAKRKGATREQIAAAEKCL